MGGLELEDDYPYAGKAHDRCSYNKTLSRVTISGAVNISNNETDMAKWLVKNGPISIGKLTPSMLRFSYVSELTWRFIGTERVNR
ncbi:Putative cysteine proteinase CG12163 [Papilio machaon]|uniref:Putative cysteine proteinase CG12163 n=1 Tax=Papilio machaon TaxID=76193 RepID=A0A0N0PF72_PAPMA|nr:Putative cysteine proteinase CG12163 [Papilio machaon]